MNWITRHSARELAENLLDSLDAIEPPIEDVRELGMRLLQHIDAAMEVEQAIEAQDTQMHRQEQELWDMRARLLALEDEVSMLAAENDLLRNSAA